MSYTAMLERLERGEADVMLADLSYSKDREERIDFTAPFMNIGVGMAHMVRGFAILMRVSHFCIVFLRYAVQE